MRYEISGTIMQTVAIDLSPGETVYSQTNTMAWMNDAIQMDTHTGGGFLAGRRRISPGATVPSGSVGAEQERFAPRAELCLEY